MLAGTGALVDYWPTGIQLPAVASGAVLPTSAVALSDLSPIAHLPQVRQVVAGRRARTSPVGLSRASDVQPRLAENLPSLPAGADDAPLDADAFEMPPRLVVATSSVIDLHRPGVMLPDMVLPEPVSRQARVVSAEADPVAADGFFGSAFKKTGASILRTGKRTGVSIADAVRGLGGVVRKALPTL